MHFVLNAFSFPFSFFEGFPGIDRELDSEETDEAEFLEEDPFAIKNENESPEEEDIDEVYNEEEY